MLFCAIKRRWCGIYGIKYLQIHFYFLSFFLRLILTENGNGETDDRTSNDGRSENESADDDSDESEEGKWNMCVLNLVTNHVFGSNDEHILL